MKLNFTFLFLFSSVICNVTSATESRTFIESDIESIHSSGLKFAEPGIGLGVGSFFSENMAVLIKVSKSLGQNFDSYKEVGGVDPILSLPTVFSETVKSLTVYSILPRYTQKFGGKIEGCISAGPSIFELEVEQAVKFVNGSSNRGGGENIPINTDVTQLGYGGTIELGAAYRTSDSFSFHVSGRYFFGQYKRDIDFDRLTNSALESTFGNLRSTQHFGGFSGSLGIGYHF